MEHLALYRKYRPKTFEEVIGQDHIIKTLKNQVENGEISHAYLFFGTRGTGKTSTAKILSKAINCLHPFNGSPCLNCEVCKALDDPSSLDILEIDAASNNRVDEIRDLKDKIKYTPVNGKYKVYIIDEVHMLTDSAFNALLKTLEEPPSHAVFILATTEAHKLPATILSRVMRFDFKLVPLEELIKLVKSIFKKEHIIADDESIKAICLEGEGSVRDTLSVADVCASYSQNNITYEKVLQALGTTTTKTLENISSAIIDKNPKELLSTIHSLFEEGKSFSVLTKDLITYFRNLLLVKSLENANTLLQFPSDVYMSMQNIAKKVKEHTLLRYMQVLSTMESELKYSKNERLLFETATLLCIFEISEIESLSKRLAMLEKGASSNPEKKLVKVEEVKKTAPITEKNIEALATTENKVTQQVSETKEVVKEQNLLKLWGQFLIELNPQEYPVLYTAVIDATPQTLQNETLVIEAENVVTQNTLNKEENKKKILEFFKSKLLVSKIEIIKKLEENSADDTINKLKQKFGETLKIIE